MGEENKVGFFDEVTEVVEGLHARTHLHWNEITALARDVATARLVADEDAQTLVITVLSESMRMLLFLKHCTDFDFDKFRFAPGEDGEPGDINVDAVMDWAMENNVRGWKFDGWCKSWDDAYCLGDSYADILYEQYRQEMDFGHRLSVAFGDVLDGSTKDIIENATGLGETLIDLIGKTKEATIPQGGIVNFAKKK